MHSDALIQFSQTADHENDIFRTYHKSICV